MSVGLTVAEDAISIERSVVSQRSHSGQKQPIKRTTEGGADEFQRILRILHLSLDNLLVQGGDADPRRS